MKPTLRLEGQPRIFNKDPVACKEKCKIAEATTASAHRHNIHKFKSSEGIAASFENPFQMEINGNEYSLSPNSVIETTPFLKKSANDLENWNIAEAKTASVTHWPNMHKPNPTHVMATRFQNSHQMEMNSNDYCLPANHIIETTPCDLDFWAKNNSNLALILETLDMVPDNDTDAWIKKNRLMALQRLESDSPDQYSSNSSLYPPYRTHSTGEMCPIIGNNPSDSGVFAISPLSSRNSLSSESGSLKDVPLSIGKGKFEKHDRPIIHQQEGIKLDLAHLRNFSKNQQSSGNNSVFLSKVKSVCKIDERTEFVCKKANQSVYEKSYPEKETSLKSFHVKNSKSKRSNKDCCETFHDKPVAKNNNNLAKLPSYDVASLMTLKSTTGFFDSHCHIDMMFSREKFQGTYADYIAQHKDSYPESYNGCIAVFCKPFTFAKENMWRKHLEQDNVWGAFGCHPKSAEFYDAKIEKDLENALDHPKVKALGEIGLDYSKGNKCSKLDQHHVFRRQLRIAQKRKLRVVIHCRDADDDAIKIMREILPKDTIFHLHCFTGSWERAQKWIAEFPNVFIGITNVVTFHSATETHEVARQLPLNRLLLETDAPYFVPSMARNGTTSSHPGMAIHVAAQIAALKNIPVDSVLNWTSANTRIVYNLT